MGASDTARLLSAAVGGHAEAREALLARLRPRVVLWVATRLSDELRAKVEAEDIAQDVLLAVHRGLDSADVPGPGALLAWVFAIAENEIRDAAKHFGARKRQPIDREPVSASSPSSVASRHEEIRRMRVALGRLSLPHREILRLRTLEERSYAECAHLLRRSEAATRVLHCRALAQLRDELEGSRHG